MTPVKAEKNHANRQQVKWHLDYKNRIKKKDFQNKSCECPMSCALKFTFKERKFLYTEFYALNSYAKKQIYIRGLSEKHPAQSSQASGENSRKDVHHKFILKLPKKSIHVCGKFFSDTFVTSLSIIYKWLRKGSAVDVDHKLIGKPSNYSAGSRNAFVLNYLNQLPCYDSHYCRRKASGKKYLDADLTVIKLYRSYIKGSEQKGEAVVSKSIFQNI